MEKIIRSIRIFLLCSFWFVFLCLVFVPSFYLIAIIIEAKMKWLIKVFSSFLIIACAGLAVEIAWSGLKRKVLNRP